MAQSRSFLSLIVTCEVVYPIVFCTRVLPHCESAASDVGSGYCVQLTVACSTLLSSSELPKSGITKSGVNQMVLLAPRLACFLFRSFLVQGTA